MEQTKALIVSHFRLLTRINKAMKIQEREKIVEDFVTQKNVSHIPVSCYFRERTELGWCWLRLLLL